MKTLLFPGQGSQKVGMGKEFYDNFKIVREYFQKTDEILKFNLSKIILEGPEAELKKTKNTQPSILLISYSIFKVMQIEFGFKHDQFKYFLGHSLGEYSALVASEAILFEEAINAVYLRGKYMQDAVPLGEGSMLAVLGLNIEEVENFVSVIKEKNNEVCEIANDNANGQIIVSGSTKQIQLLYSELSKSKKKSMLLPVSAPFHCSLMKPAEKKMENVLDNIKINEPRVPIIHNATAVKNLDKNNIKDLLLRQISSKVRWRESILNISDQGIKTFIEVGPGKILSGMVKRTIKNASSFSINQIEDIKNIKNV